METATKRPESVECPDWKALPGHPNPKRCFFYDGKGGCTLDARGACTEWVKAKRAAITSDPLPSPPPTALSLLAAPPTAAAGPADASLTPDGALALTPAPKPQAKPQGAAEAARAAWAAANASKALGPGFDSVGFEHVPAKAIDPLAVASLKAFAPEVHLVSPHLGDVYLVAKLTGQDRFEMTFEDAATLRLIVDAFPGAQVVELRRAPR